MLTTDTARVIKVMISNIGAIVNEGLSNAGLVRIVTCHTFIKIGFEVKATRLSVTLAFLEHKTVLQVTNRSTIVCSNCWSNQFLIMF